MGRELSQCICLGGRAHPEYLPQRRAAARRQHNVSTRCRKRVDVSSTCGSSKKTHMPPSTADILSAPLIAALKPISIDLSITAVDPCTEDSKALGNGGTWYLSLRVKPLMQTHCSPAALTAMYADYSARIVCAAIDNGKEQLGCVAGTLSDDLCFPQRQRVCEVQPQCES